MRRAGIGTWLPLFFLLAAGAGGQPEEPFRPKGFYNNSVHRFHPDLDARLNAAEFVRWRTLEIAWTSGMTAALDREIAADIASLVSRTPRLPPEADRLAPLLARDAIPIFRALRWGHVLQRQLLDVLASSDTEKGLSAARLERALLLYRRERWALSEPAGLPPAAPPETTAAWRIETSGMGLFVRAAADLTTPDFAEQRWLVKQTIARFDRTYGGDHPSGEATYAEARAVADAFPGVAEALDRVERFRREVLEAMAAGGATREALRERAERLRGVARRYGLSTEGIGER